MGLRSKFQIRNDFVCTLTIYISIENYIKNIRFLTKIFKVRIYNHNFQINRITYMDVIAVVSYFKSHSSKILAGFLSVLAVVLKGFVAGAVSISMDSKSTLSY